MNDICRAALDTYGAEAQIMMVFEEMAELQKELCKNTRGSRNTVDIAEEIADVEIMLAQMKLLFDIVKETEDWKAVKLARLKRRLEDARSAR